MTYIIGVMLLVIILTLSHLFIYHRGWMAGWKEYEKLVELFESDERKE